MAYPILAPNSSWYKSTQKRSTITQINIVDTYSGGTADETWNADVDNSGSIKCYRTGTVLTISGNGSGKIAMNPDSLRVFSHSSDMFTSLTTLSGLALLDASNVTTLVRAFDRCTKVTALDVDGWDVSKVETLERTFQGCISLSSLDLSRWNVSTCKSMKGMFLSDSTSIGEMVIASIGDVSNWQTSKVEDMSYMFQDCSALKTVECSEWNVSAVKSMEGMFLWCTSLETLDLSKWDVSNVTIMRSMFYQCMSLESVGDTSGWNPYSCTSMKRMFYQCHSLKALDVSNWDTLACTDMSTMFYQCYLLQTLNVKDWNVSNVTTMSGMFGGAPYGDPAMQLTELDVSNWDTSSCADMAGMFYGCKRLKNLDISNWDVSKVESFDHFMAHSGIKLTGDGVARWVTSAAKTMDAMLYSCQNEVLDVSNFDTSNVLTFNQMFESCTKLKKIIGLENFVTSTSQDFSEMFWNCTSLEELNLSAFDTRNATDGADRYGREGEKTTKMVRFFDDEINSLKKVILGKNFSFNGDGKTTTNSAVLPTPSGSMWYNASGESFAPEDVPDGIYATYFSVRDDIDRDVLVKYGTLTRMADSIRDETEEPYEYTASEIADSIRMLSNVKYISSAELYAAAAVGGVISLAPDADITVSQTLTLPAGTVILGNGATIRRAAGFEGILFFLNAGCRIENFVIEGNRSEMVSPTWEKTIEISTRANCVIDGITINDANEGIIVYEDDVLVRGCKLYNCGGNGIHMSGADRTRIENCVIIGANKNASQMRHSDGCIIWSDQCCDAVVENCWCEDGIAGFGAIDNALNSNIKLIGNTVKGCGNAVHGRFITSAPHDLQILGNHFIDNGRLRVAVNVIDGIYYPYTEGFVISDNIFDGTGIHIGGFQGAVVSGNTVRGDILQLDYCPCSVVADNIVENPAGIGIYLSSSPKTNVSGNNVRCKNYGVYAENSTGIMISGNIVRQSPHNVNADCFKLNECPEAAIDNNKLFVYYGGGITAESNCRTMGNFIVCADSSQIAIRVWGGKSGYIVAQNMSNGTFAVANGTNAVIQNNITMTSTAFVDVVYTLTNLTTDGFAKALTDDDFEFTLTAASGYTLPDTITVTMGGTALAAGTGYAYDKATGKVTVYRVSGAVEVAGGAA